MRRHDRDDRREREDRHRSDSQDSRRERDDRERGGGEWESTPSRRQAPPRCLRPWLQQTRLGPIKVPQKIAGNFHGDACSFSGMVLLEWCPQAGTFRCLCPWVLASACSMRPQLQQHHAGNACWPQRASGPSGCLAGLLHEPCSAAFTAWSISHRVCQGNASPPTRLSQLALAGMMETASGTALPGGTSGSGRGPPAGTGEPPGGECTLGGPPGRPAHPQHSPPYVLAAQQV